MKGIWNSIRMKSSSIKQYIMLLVVLIFFIFIGYEYYFKYSYILRDPNILKDVILSYGNFSILIFILMQILQVVVFFIPGEFIQIAGGYIFGAVVGGLVSIVGITLGSIVAYLISNIYGKPLVKRLMEHRKIKLFRKILNAGSKKTVVFVFYLIPGIPKDALAYICGVSNISFIDFLIYSTLGRIPGIFISSFFGQKLYVGDSKSLIAIGVIMAIISIIGVFKGDAIIKAIIKKRKSY